MKTFLTILLATFCAATSYGQTMKALSYNMSNNTVVATQRVTFSALGLATGSAAAPSLTYAIGTNVFGTFATTALGVGPHLGFSVNGTRQFYIATNTIRAELPISFSTTTNAAETRTNLSLGSTNIVTFAGLTNNGDITINSTTASNGLLFIRRTNNEAFLGLANLLASNNTTISNETLFRVGVAEATNRSAQFGFRSTNTNGSGVAVFSVFGYNALMQIGVDASTNAVIFSGGGTNNQVMTLIKSGATEFARPISFANTTNAATTRTNVGLPLPALTNTSNVTTMRALSGSTNTNAPFSGTVILANLNQFEFQLVISNGIIVSVEEL